MKVRCIDNCSSSAELILGKEYEVLVGTTDRYVILNELGYSDAYYKDRFEIAVESVNLSEAYKQLDGTKFKMTFPFWQEDNRYIEVEKRNGELTYFNSDIKSSCRINSMYNLSDLLSAKFEILTESKWIECNITDLIKSRCCCKAILTDGNEFVGDDVWEVLDLVYEEYKSTKAIINAKWFQVGK